MDLFIARQPIFDRKREVYGYELLFRSGFENFFSYHDVDKAASQMIGDSAVMFGLETLTGNKKAFINLTRQSLLSDYAALLPKGLAVLEILETVEPDDQVIAIVRNLKQQGYTLALDDFVFNADLIPLIKMVDIIKVDFLNTTREQQVDYFESFAPQGKLFLAEKLETQADYKDAYDIGYHFFQGYFFSKPVVLSRKGVTSTHTSMMKVLKEIHQPGINFKRMEEIIQGDLTLSYKLLRYINSVFFGLNTEVRSIKHALVLMGENEIKKWATLVSLSSMGEDKPIELIQNAAIRARVCEELASLCNMKDKSSDFFLIGLFSVIDAILDRNLAEALKDIPIARELKTALMRVAPNPFRMALETVLAYEQGDWESLERWTGKLGVPEEEIPKIYLEAVKWATDSKGE